MDIPSRLIIMIFTPEVDLNNHTLGTQENTKRSHKKKIYTSISMDVCM